MHPSDYEIRQFALDSAIRLIPHDEPGPVYSVKENAEIFRRFLAAESDYPECEPEECCTYDACAPAETCEAPPPQEDIDITVSPYTIVRVNGVTVWS